MPRPVGRVPPPHRRRSPRLAGPSRAPVAGRGGGEVRRVRCECGGCLVVRKRAGSQLWTGRCDTCGRTTCGERPVYRAERDDYD